MYSPEPVENRRVIEMDKGDIMRLTIRQRPRETKQTCILFYTGLEIRYLTLSAMSGPMLRLDKLYNLFAIFFPTFRIGYKFYNPFAVIVPL